jgi:hypothetical protein
VPGHEGIVRNETADLLARTGSEHLFTGPEPACGISIGLAKRAVIDWMNRNNAKQWESITGLKTGKGTYSRTLRQKNRGSVEIKQIPIMMDSRTIQRTPSSEGRLFKLGSTGDPICERCLEEDESATHVLCDCEAVAHLRFCHLAQFFMEPATTMTPPTFNSKGKHKSSVMVMLQGLDCGPPLIYTCIHTYIQEKTHSLYPRNNCGCGVFCGITSVISSTDVYKR